MYQGVDSQNSGTAPASGLRGERWPLSRAEGKALRRYLRGSSQGKEKGRPVIPPEAAFHCLPPP